MSARVSMATWWAVWKIARISYCSFRKIARMYKISAQQCGATKPRLPLLLRLWSGLICNEMYRVERNTCRGLGTSLKYMRTRVCETWDANENPWLQWKSINLKNNLQYFVTLQVKIHTVACKCALNSSELAAFALLFGSCKTAMVIVHIDSMSNRSDRDMAGNPATISGWATVWNSYICQITVACLRNPDT